VSASQPLLAVDNLECVRDGRTLFSALSLRVKPAEVISLQGPNGAGKSTLLRCIAGLYPDYEGTVQAAPFVYLGHKPGVSGALSTVENLTYLAELANDGARGEAESGSFTWQDSPMFDSVLGALEAVELAGYEDVRCANLSAGQLRRVGLARLLLSRAPLWLLDEPLTALDDLGAHLLGRVLSQHIDGGGAAVCATHQQLPLDDVRRIELTPSGVVSATA